jgi:hypothetical protein
VDPETLRRRVRDAIFRLAPLNGVRQLSLDGLSVDDLRALELAVQHIEQNIATAERKARRAPWLP